MASKSLGNQVNIYYQRACVVVDKRSRDYTGLQGQSMAAVCKIQKTLQESLASAWRDG